MAKYFFFNKNKPEHPNKNYKGAAANSQGNVAGWSWPGPNRACKKNLLRDVGSHLAQHV